MKKMIIIAECFQCPHSFRFRDGGPLECNKKEKVIHDSYSIPDWCPLPNAPKEPKRQSTQ